jgi:large subunit ribosomal protein L18
MMGKVDPKYIRRERRKKAIRRKISGTPNRPRLSVFKSNRGIYAQLIDDVNGKTLCSASTMDKEYKGKKAITKETAKEVGTLIGKRAVDKGINLAVFDRNGYVFHGRIQALKEGCEENGLKFSLNNNENENETNSEK